MVVMLGTVWTTVRLVLSTVGMLTFLWKLQQWMKKAPVLLVLSGCVVTDSWLEMTQSVPLRTVSASVIRRVISMVLAPSCTSVERTGWTLTVGSIGLRVGRWGVFGRCVRRGGGW